MNSTIRELSVNFTTLREEDSETEYLDINELQAETTRTSFNVELFNDSEEENINTKNKEKKGLGNRRYRFDQDDVTRNSDPIPLQKTTRQITLAKHVETSGQDSIEPKFNSYIKQQDSIPTSTYKSYADVTRNSDPIPFQKTTRQITLEKHIETSRQDTIETNIIGYIKQQDSIPTSTYKSYADVTRNSDPIPLQKTTRQITLEKHVETSRQDTIEAKFICYMKQHDSIPTSTYKSYADVTRNNDPIPFQKTTRQITLEKHIETSRQDIIKTKFIGYKKQQDDSRNSDPIPFQKTTRQITLKKHIETLRQDTIEAKFIGYMKQQDVTRNSDPIPFQKTTRQITLKKHIETSRQDTIEARFIGYMKQQDAIPPPTYKSYADVTRNSDPIPFQKTTRQITLKKHIETSRQDTIEARFIGYMKQQDSIPTPTYKSYADVTRNNDPIPFQKTTRQITLENHIETSRQDTMETKFIGYIKQQDSIPTPTYTLYADVTCNSDPIPFQKTTRQITLEKHVETSRQDTIKAQFIGYIKQQDDRPKLNRKFHMERRRNTGTADKQTFIKKAFKKYVNDNVQSTSQARLSSHSKPNDKHATFYVSLKGPYQSPPKKVHCNNSKNTKERFGCMNSKTDFNLNKCSKATTSSQCTERTKEKCGISFVSCQNDAKGNQYTSPKFDNLFLDKSNAQPKHQLSSFPKQKSERSDMCEIPKNKTIRFSGYTKSNLGIVILLLFLFAKEAKGNEIHMNIYPQPVVIGKNVKINCIPFNPLNMSYGSLAWWENDGRGFKLLCINEALTPEATMKKYSCGIEKTKNNQITTYTLNVQNFSFPNSEYEYRCVLQNFLTKTMSFPASNYSYNYIPNEKEINLILPCKSEKNISVVIEKIFPEPFCVVNVKGRNVPTMNVMTQDDTQFYRLNLEIRLEDYMWGQIMRISCLFGNEMKPVSDKMVSYCRSSKNSSTIESSWTFIQMAIIFACWRTVV